MEIGFVGLGKMGMNMVQRLLNDGHKIIAYARTESTVQKAVDIGATGAESLKDMVEQLPAPRIIWVMVPSGKATEDTVSNLSELLNKGDIYQPSVYYRNN